MKKNDPNRYLPCRWENCMQDHRLRMSILHGAVLVWGKAAVLGNVFKVTVGSDQASASAVLILFLNILSEPLLSLWPLFCCFVSLRSVWLHSHCNCPSSICELWLQDPQHPLCLTTQNSSFYLSSGYVPETPDISATLCQTLSVLFSYPSCSGLREGSWGMDKHRVFKMQQGWVEGYDNLSLLVTVLMKPGLWFPLFAMRVHCWLIFNLSSSWSFSAGLIDCFPTCTDARGYPALGTELGSPSCWTFWGSCWPRPEVCWGTPGLKVCHSCASYFLIFSVVYRFGEGTSELSSRKHIKIFNYISSLLDPGILWLLLEVNHTSVWLYPLITALWYGWSITAAFNSRFISLYYLSGVQPFLKLVF